ncbi:hypothetical protein [Burkholderia sp. Se-20378]|nr:hypothetical protein [Burkholderia sp. Se-20378]MBN3770398.1 hypothetical protein [Burkholderia sp. Se-20378]
MRDAAVLYRHGNEKARIDNTVDAGSMRFWRLRAAMRPGCVYCLGNT